MAPGPPADDEDSDDSMPPLSQVGAVAGPNVSMPTVASSAGACTNSFHVLDADSDDSMPPLKPLSEQSTMRPSVGAAAASSPSWSADHFDDSDDSMPPLQAASVQSQEPSATCLPAESVASDDSMPPLAAHTTTPKESHGSDSDDARPPLTVGGKEGVKANVRQPTYGAGAYLSQQHAALHGDVPDGEDVDDGGCFDTDGEDDDDVDNDDDGMPPLSVSGLKRGMFAESCPLEKAVAGRHPTVVKQTTKLTMNDLAEDSNDSMPPLTVTEDPQAQRQVAGTVATPISSANADIGEDSDDSMPPIHDPAEQAGKRGRQQKENTAGTCYDRHPLATENGCGEFSTGRNFQDSNGSDSDASMPPLLAIPASARRLADETAGMADEGLVTAQSQKPVRISSDSSGELLPGDVVVLVNLKQSTNLNDEMAKVIRVRPEVDVRKSVRVELKLLKNGRQFSVKRVNLRKVEDVEVSEPSAESDNSMPPLVLHDTQGKPARAESVHSDVSVFQNDSQFNMSLAPPQPHQPSTAPQKQMSRKEKPDSLQVRKGFFVGDLVELHGVARGELNGQKGYIVPSPDGYHLKKHQIIVKMLQNGKLLAVAVKRLTKLQWGLQDEGSGSDMPSLELIPDTGSATGSRAKPGQYSVGQQGVLRNMQRTEYSGQVVTVVSAGKPLMPGHVAVQLSTGKRVIVPEGNLTSVRRPNAQAKMPMTRKPIGAAGGNEVRKPPSPTQTPAAKPVVQRPQRCPPRSSATLAAAAKQSPERSALVLWCQAHQLPMELVEKLEAEDVTDAMDLAALRDEELDEFSRGLKLGTKARFLTAVRKMRTESGL